MRGSDVGNRLHFNQCMYEKTQDLVAVAGHVKNIRVRNGQ